MRTCPRCGQQHARLKSWCAPCAASYSAAYRKANREKLLAGKAAHYEANKSIYIKRAKEWKISNPEKVSACIKSYYEKNKEKERARLKAWEISNSIKRISAKKTWRKENKSRLAAQCRARQATKINATPSWADLNLIAVEYSLASWCSEVMRIEYHVDHVVPLQGRNVCGLHVHNNLQVIQATENLRKSNRHD